MKTASIDFHESPCGCCAGESVCAPRSRTWSHPTNCCRQRSRPRARLAVVRLRLAAGAFDAPEIRNRRLSVRSRDALLNWLCWRTTGSRYQRIDRRIRRLAIRMAGPRPGRSEPDWKPRSMSASWRTRATSTSTSPSDSRLMTPVAPSRKPSAAVSAAPTRSMMVGTSRWRIFKAASAFSFGAPARYGGRQWRRRRG